MRSLPDIFTSPWLALDDLEKVMIPAADPEDEGIFEEEAVLSEGGETEEPPERRKTERRAGERRQSDRRAEDGESEDSVLRRYRERLSLAEAEFFQEVEPELREMLEEQMAVVREQAYRDQLVRQGGEIRQSLAALGEGMRAIEADYRSYLKEFAEELKFMALEIAERILHKEIEADEHALAPMAMQLVSEVKNASWVNVEISEQVKSLAEHLKTQLSRAEQGLTVYVSTREAMPDSCRIATEEGVIDATLSVQLNQLRQAFVQAQEEGE